MDELFYTTLLKMTLLSQVNIFTWRIYLADLLETTTFLLALIKICLLQWSKTFTCVFYLLQ